MKEPLPPILKAFHEYCESYGIQRAKGRFSLGDYALKSLLNYDEKRPIRVHTLRKMYEFFDKEFDDFFFQNCKKFPYWKNRYHSVIGNIFRSRRIKKGFTVHMVASKLKLDNKTIERLENGITLPSANSYTIQNLLSLYEFSPKERQSIEDLINTTHETIKHFKKYL